MKIKTYYNILQLKKEWNKMYLNNNNLTPFQSYDYNKNICIFRYLDILKSRLLPIFVAIQKDDEVLMIAPLLRSIRGNYFMLGDIQGCGVTDMIYKSNMSKELAYDCIRCLISYCKYVRFARFSCSSPFYEICKELIDDNKMIQETSVKIRFNNDYDEYYNHLSKHVRQNLRTSYNRLVKDNKNYQIKVFEVDDMNFRVWSKITSVYCKRQKNNYGASGVFQKIKCLFWKHDSISLRFNDNTFCSVLMYDGCLAAVLMGLYNTDKTSIIVPRLAINSEYFQYSPGNQLINETVKYLIDNSSVRILDLSRGTEKYKYMMGGEDYFTVNFDLLNSNIKNR